MLNWYEISHFERPDSSYPDYDRYFGHEEDRPEYADPFDISDYLEDDDETQIL